jgi:hypothetical protein
VYPSEQARRGRQPATFLSREEWPEAGAWLQAGIERTELGTNRFLALLGQQGVSTNANRLKKYRAGLLLPEADTLRAICRVAKLSYVEAADRFGYYREIVRFFDDLIWLGDLWLEEDDARGGTLNGDGSKASRLLSLRDTGVTYWNGKRITVDLLKSPGFLNRYCVGVWHEPEREVERVEYPWIEQEGSNGILVPDMSQPPTRREKYAEPQRSVPRAVPKPTAVAILLAVLAFPLRGDGYKEGASEYRYNLGNAAVALIREAQRLRIELRAVGRPKSLHPLLQRACDALDDRGIPFNYRRPVAAEYVVMWTHAICQPFTHYARLAAFDFWGEAGGKSWSTAVAPLCVAPGEAMDVLMPRPSAFAMLPQLRPADLLEIEQLTTSQ